MRCINSRHSIEESIKKSRFIGIVMPCHSEAEVLSELKQLREQHAGANHIAFAYRIKSPEGMLCRFYDDGEPSGTAGKPIFQHLEGKQLINVLVAVIRYFGGVKLGAGGLTRAYGNAAKAVIDAAGIVDHVEMKTVQLTIDYNRMQALEYQLKKLDGEIIAQNFTEQVDLTVRLPEQNVEILLGSI